MAVTILKGTIISAPSPGKLDATENGYLVAENGVITGMFPTLPEQYAGADVEDFGGALRQTGEAVKALGDALRPILPEGSVSDAAITAEKPFFTFSALISKQTPPAFFKDSSAPKRYSG